MRNHNVYISVYIMAHYIQRSFKVSCQIKQFLIRKSLYSKWYTVLDVVKKKCLTGSNVNVKGWVKSTRKMKDIIFVDINDGSCAEKLQIVIPKHLKQTTMTFGSAIEAEGTVQLNPINNQVEVVVVDIKIVGTCDPTAGYPFAARKSYPDDYLRQFLHFRPRHSTFASVMRIRDAITRGLHDILRKSGFVLVHTPILTSNDCEGAGEVFSVCPQSEKLRQEMAKEGLPLEESYFNSKSYLTVSGQLHLEAAKLEGSSHTYQLILTLLPRKWRFCLKSSELSTTLKRTMNRKMVLDKKSRAVEMFQDVIKKESTILAITFTSTKGLSKVYTFGPVFRAENSRSRLHLSEFYMLEAELAFSETLDDAMDLTETLVRGAVVQLLKDSHDDLVALEKFTSSKIMIQLEKLVDAPAFARLDYSEAINILQQNSSRLEKPPPQFGETLGKEHELFLSQHMTHKTGQPLVFVINWPTTLKPFYVKHSSDRPDQALAFDLLGPIAGEICGGSVRESCAITLEKILQQNEGGQVLLKSLQWYLDIRRHGNCPTSGFGLGFERFLQCLLGIPNIKDTLPFPRWPHNLRM